MAVQIFRKDDHKRYEAEEYIEMLQELLSKEKVVFHRLECSFLDYCAYEKHWTITSKNRIQDIFDNDYLLTEAEAFFSDPGKNYKFRYVYRKDDHLELETDDK